MLAKEVTVDSSVNLVNPALQENLQQRRESFGLFFACLFVCFLFARTLRSFYKMFLLKPTILVTQKTKSNK